MISLNSQRSKRRPNPFQSTNRRISMSAPFKTHHVYKTFFEGPHGERSEPIEERVHVSRTCASCAHDGLKDADWRKEGGIELYGRCMNNCSAIDAQEPADQWCGLHSTPPEWAAGVARITRPVFALVQGGAS
jgi:hypothetical protein